MNRFFITCVALFASYCICQKDTSKLAPKMDSENMILCDTYVQTHEINYLWTIHQFKTYEAFNTEISSPMLRAPSTDEYEWYIEVGPYNANEENDDVAISLEVYLSNSSTFRNTMSAMINVSIVNHENKILFYKNLATAGEFKAGSSYCNGRGWSSFCKNDHFFSNHLLQNDTLKLLIHIRWLTEEKSCNVVRHNVSLSDGTTTETETTTTKRNLNTENLESMLENPKYADVVFITNGSKYPAHKNILAARSSVFDAMFQRKHSKNVSLKKIRINVTPMNEKVLRAMLRYIYTGKCEELGDLTERLLEAATKYGLDGLKKICQQRLRKTYD